MAITAPRGTQDFLPEQTAEWQLLERKIRQICSLYGFGEIRTPLFESTELFLRGIGETTDVVTKEMYTFNDRGGRSMTLRPENTASVVRAFLEHKLYGDPQVHKFYYMGPMFRHDRPQAGRYRQFNQFGVEEIGSRDPAVDAEIIAMAFQLFRELGLTDLDLHLNSVGCPKCRPVYRQKLIEFYADKKDMLCDDCKARLDKNPLRVLDCKEEGCKQASVGVPELTDNLCDDCRDHFTKVQQYLTAVGIPFTLDPRLVRGLDYYTNTAFEIMYAPLGAQSTVCGGGRYDGLIEEVGGPSTPGIGFAIGMERLLLTLKEQGLLPPPQRKRPVFIVALGDAAKTAAFTIQQQLREKGIYAEIDLMGRSMKGQMKSANKLEADYTVIIGEDELAGGQVQVRDMNTKEQLSIPMNGIIEYMETHKKG
ncbi:histidyl-tRNA synthetase [Megasphaera cerevisiae DSM 20462]|uniref:Histidine--tRNA ligase n=1 Tax=Megasphaera cerevisiae DSM 20462 TaxID=1122219 RepID=A0A0J6ZMB1_9FIRM|nr:histidine--tRNA ligase [Megasphaera cerevisiae]KMO86006.1 histidyl-tRNA synthetase [Megasphaera cerevisiae DSM 20462]SJZ73811.1 histidyl-tRNA synthetase [Megasphaera cerevisiae DSM 20462]